MTIELTRIVASTAIAATASVLAESPVRQANTGAAAAQITRRMGIAGSALRRERLKSTAYSRSVSRRQIQTRSHAYQTIPPVKMPPAREEREHRLQQRRGRQARAAVTVVVDD